MTVTEVPAPSPLTIEQRLQALEAKAKTDVTGAEAWLKANWAHFVTWAGIAYTIVKHVV